MTYSWRHRVLLGVETGLHFLGDLEHVLLFISKDRMTEWKWRYLNLRPLFSAQNAEMVSADAAVAESTRFPIRRRGRQVGKRTTRQTDNQASREPRRRSNGIHSRHVITPLGPDHQQMTPLAELVQASRPRPHRHPQDRPTHKHALQSMHALHPAHRFLLGSAGIQVQQAEDGVLCGIPESVGGEDGVAAAAGRHA